MTLSEALRWFLTGLCFGMGFAIAQGLLELVAGLIKRRT